MPKPTKRMAAALAKAPGDTAVSVSEAVNILKQFNTTKFDQSVEIATLDRMAGCRVDMLTTLIVGNSRTRRFEAMLITPRGYLAAPDDPAVIGSGPDPGRPAP